MVFKFLKKQDYFVICVISRHEDDFSIFSKKIVKLIYKDKALFYCIVIPKYKHAGNYISDFI